MTEEDWRNRSLNCLGIRFAGDAIDEVDERGRRIVDDTLLLLLNAHDKAVSFVMPAHRTEVRWEQILDTREPTGEPRNRRHVKGGQIYRLESRSVTLFRLQSNEDREEKA